MNPADAMPFSKLMGVTVTAASAEAVEGEITVREDLCTAGGIMHGGAIAGLIDTAVVPAIGSSGVEPTRMVTISMNINYMGAISDEDAVCEGWVTRQGRSIVFCSAEVTGADSGRVCATGTLVYKV